MISIQSSGSFKHTEAFLRAMLKLDATIMDILNSAGDEGVAALSSASPVDSGLSAGSWGYRVSKSGGGVTIAWTNTDLENGFPVAIMLQYGYGTGTGGYVQGRDYINPAMRPIFDRIADKVWKAVTSA